MHDVCYFAKENNCYWILIIVIAPPNSKDFTLKSNSHLGKSSLLWMENPALLFRQWEKMLPNDESLWVTWNDDYCVSCITETSQYRFSINIFRWTNRKTRINKTCFRSKIRTCISNLVAFGYYDYKHDHQMILFCA